MSTRAEMIASLDASLRGERVPGDIVYLPRPSKYQTLFIHLDALDLYETWKIVELPSPTIRALYVAYQRSSPHRKVAYHTLPDGWLFVRLQ